MTGAAAFVVLGDVATDVVARVSAPLATGSDTPARIGLTGGGSGANVAAWLAHTGAAVSFVGRAGDDEAGRARLAELSACGVEPHVALDPRLATGSVVVIVSADGERTMLPDRGANLGLREADVPPALLRAGAHLHVSGYALLDDGPRAAALHALRRACEAGMHVSVDAASSEPLRRVGATRFLAWTSGAGTCLANRPEAAALTGRDSAHQAAALLGRAYGEAVVTLGQGGALWSDGVDVVQGDAASADVVDTTGAGDAFAAGYLRARRAGGAPPEWLAAGAALAAEAVARGGARP